MLVKFEENLLSKGVSPDKIKSSVDKFSHWVIEDLMDWEELHDNNVGISDFYILDNRIMRWQHHYDEKPEDCPGAEWPLFKKYEKVNLGDYGRTPLHNAVIDSNIQLVKRLLDRGEYNKDQDNGGNTAFELAVLEGKDAIVEIFMDNGIYS